VTAEAAHSLATAAAAIGTHDYDGALEVLADAAPLLRAEPAAELRALLDEAWSRMSIGEVEAAVAVLERARPLAEGPGFGDVDRAEVLFRLGCCRLKLGAVPNALQLLTLALELCNRSEQSSDRLRADIHRWRTRCYRRQREWDAARADAEAAIELAEGLRQERELADAYLQASLVAERVGQLLVARFYAERAVDLFRQAGERLDAGKALNNLGGICFLLGRSEEAMDRLKEAFTIALDLGHDVDAAYAVSSTAQILQRNGDPHAAEKAARRALDLLEGRDDHVNEIGSAQLVLGRSLLDQERLDEAARAFSAADDSFSQMDSLGHRAAVWLAQGDLAARRGDIDTAATVYRRAAEALQDVRF
jgi:tetratricopeptide (TPR) repeat protein